MTCLRPVHGLLPQLRGDGIVSSAGGAAIGLSEGLNVCDDLLSRETITFDLPKNKDPDHRLRLSDHKAVYCDATLYKYYLYILYYTYYSDVSNSVLGKDLLGRDPHSEGFSGWSWNTSKHSSASPAQTQNSHSTEQPG